MPTCQAYKCMNTTGRTTKGKSFFKIPEPKNATEWKRTQQWLHNMGMGEEIKTFKFSRNSILCEDHFHKDCIKRNLMYEHFNMQPGKKRVSWRSCTSNFCSSKIYRINMDGTKVLLPRHVSENKRKWDAEKDHQQGSFVSQ